MNTFFTERPRTFTVKGLEVRDWGKIELEAGDLVSFRTPSGKECDFSATQWGFYLGPSLNSSLARQGFRTALVVNESWKVFLNAVDEDKIDLFRSYLAEQNSRVLCWLDEALR